MISLPFMVGKDVVITDTGNGYICMKITVGMIMKVRLKVLQLKKPSQYALANKYFKFLGKRTKLSEKDRYNISFE